MSNGSKNSWIALAWLAILILAVVLLSGCQWCGTSGDTWKNHYQAPPPPERLGAVSDPIWRNQEANAEVSDFTVYDHEFQGDTERLNLAGEDHVKQIAARLSRGQEAPVVVERSMRAPARTGEYRYAIHADPKLDMRRREILVRSLSAMGIADAEQRVVVAPAMAAGVTGNEAESAYRQGLGGSDYGAGSGNFGGFLLRGGS